MNYFKETKAVLERDYKINAENFTRIELLEAIKKIDTEVLFTKFEMDDYIYNYHLNIDYDNLYKTRVKNYRIIQQHNKVKRAQILNCEFKINHQGLLFYIDTVDKKVIYDTFQTTHEIDKLVVSYISFSFNKDWGYFNFILSNYDLILVDLVKNKSNFYGYQLRDSLKEIIPHENEDEINDFTIDLLVNYTLRSNAINIC